MTALKLRATDKTRVQNPSENVIAQHKIYGIENFFAKLYVKLSYQLLTSLKDYFDIFNIWRL